MAGKGSARRPQAVSDEEMAKRWERALGPAGSHNYAVGFGGGVVKLRGTMSSTVEWRASEFTIIERLAP